MTFRVVIATQPLRGDAATVMINPVYKTISRGRCCVRFGSQGKGWQLHSALLLREGAGGVTRYSDLIDILYGGDEDGGPLSPRNCIAVLVNLYKVRFHHLGFSIGSQHCGRRWRPIELIDLWAEQRRAA